MYLIPWWVCWVTCLVSCPNLNFTMLLSEQLSSSHISQSWKFWSSRLLITVKSMLLLRLRLWNVVLSFSSFIICRSLIIRISSTFYLLSLIIVSYLWSGIAVFGDEDAWAFAELYYFVNLCRLCVCFFIYVKIHACHENPYVLYFSSKTLSLSLCWLISNASIFSLVIIMAARLLSSVDI